MSRSHRLAAGLALLALVAGLLAFALPRVAELEIRVHDLELLPAASGVGAVDREIERRFGMDSRLVVVLEAHAWTVTDPRFAHDLALFVDELATSRNLSLFLIDRLYRPRPLSASAEPGAPVLERPSPAWVAAALEGTKSAAVLGASADRRAAFVELQSLSSAGIPDVEALVERAAHRVEEARPGAYTVRLVGRDRVLHGLGEAIFDDLSRLLPWTFALVFVLLLWLWRSVVLAALSLVETGLAVLVTMALLQLLDQDVSIMTAMIPVLVTVLGIADEIHLIAEYLRLSDETPTASSGERARRALARVFFPCTATTFTTVLGFASFLATDVPALRLFGLLASAGVVISWAFTMTLVPVALAVADVRRVPPWLAAGRVPLPAALLRRPAAVAATVLLVPGALLLAVDDGWTRNFRAEQKLVQDVAWFQDASVGIYLFDVMAERTDGRSWTEPALLAQLDRLVREVETLSGVTAAAGLPDLVRDRAWELDRAVAGSGVRTVSAASELPGAEAEIARILATYRLFNEETVLRTFLTLDGASTRLMVATEGDDYATSTAVRRDLDRLLATTFADQPVAVAVGGSAERGRVLIQSVVESQAASVAAALVLSWLALGFASNRWWLALRVVASVAWALALVLGGAGWLGVPLGVASSCFLALGVGVGLDYAVHLAFGAHHPGAGGGLHARVLANVLVVGLGLAVLGLSSNPTIARLGLLVVASMVATGFTAMVVFPGPSQRS